MIERVSRRWNFHSRTLVNHTIAAVYKRIDSVALTFVSYLPDIYLFPIVAQTFCDSRNHILVCPLIINK